MIVWIKLVAESGESASGMGSEWCGEYRLLVRILSKKSDHGDKQHRQAHERDRNEKPGYHGVPPHGESPDEEIGIDQVPAPFYFITLNF